MFGEAIQMLELTGTQMNIPFQKGHGLNQGSQSLKLRCHGEKRIVPFAKLTGHAVPRSL